MSNYTIQTLSLTSAETGLVVHGPWQAVRVLEALNSSGDVDPTVKIDLRWGQAAEDSFPMRHGDASLSRTAQKVAVLSWDAQAGAQVKVGFSSDADAVDWAVGPAATTTSITGTVTTEETKAATITGSGDTTRATGGHDTIAANADRRELFVQADADNTGVIALRDGSSNAFVELQAGEAFTLTSTAAIQVRNDSGATQTYRYLEVED